MDASTRQLRMFLAVAEHLHFGRAAAAMYVSQPVASQEIRRLEQALGFLLFERSSRSVQLTEAGEGMRAAAAEAVAASDAFADLARRFAAEGDAVRVAATPSVIDGLMPRLLRAAEREQPALEIDDVPIETGEAADAVAQGCDVVLGRFLDLPERYRVDLLRRDRLRVALSARHPLASSDGIRLAELADIPLLLWPRQRNPRYYDRLLEICVEGGLDPLVLVSRPRLIGAQAYLLTDARAFALVPESTARHLPTEVATVAIEGEPTLPLSIAWLAGDPRTAVRRVIALAHRVAGEGDGAFPPASRDLHA